MELLAIIPRLLDLLKGAGIIKDSAQEQEYRLKLLEMAAAGDAAWADFIRYTQPTGTVAAGLPWFVNLLAALQNFIVSLVRPTVTAFAAYHIYTSLSAGRDPNAIAYIPVAFWFLGRSAEKLVSGKLAVLLSNGRNGNGRATAPSVPSYTPPPTEFDTPRER